MNEQPEPYTRDKHLAWLASLSPDEQYRAWAPAGHQWNMITASLFKRWLLGKMDAGLRLRLLEGLNGMTDIYLRPEMLVMIEPICDTGYKIWEEAKTLDREGDKGCASYKVLTSPRVFDHLTTLNPSILAALRWRAMYRGDATQQQTAFPVELASDQTTAPPAPASNGAAAYAAAIDHGIPERFFSRQTRPVFAIGTPGHADGEFDLHKGR
jgi:hypothetical protein